MTKQYSQRDPNRCPPHPGGLIREFAIPDAGKSKAQIAKDLGISRQHLYDISDEKRPITPAVALRLAKYFGGSATIYVAMQAKHDLWKAEREVDLSEVPELGAVG